MRKLGNNKPAAGKNAGLFIVNWKFNYGITTFT